MPDLAGDDEAKGTDDRKDQEDTDPVPRSDVLPRSPLMRGPLRDSLPSGTPLSGAVRLAPRLAEETVLAGTAVLAEEMFGEEVGP